jgi:hypothetical protein
MLQKRLPSGLYTIVCGRLSIIQPDNPAAAKNNFVCYPDIAGAGGLESKGAGVVEANKRFNGACT